MLDLCLIRLALTVPAAFGAWMLVVGACRVLRVRDPRLRLALSGLAIVDVLLVTVGWSVSSFLHVHLVVSPALVEAGLGPWSTMALVGWALVAALLVVRRLRTARSTCVTAAALARWFPPTEAVLAEVRSASGRLAIAAPRVALVPGGGGPFVVGIRRPHLVIPRGAWDALDPAARTATLMHEMVHVRRRDNLVLLAVGLVCDGLFFNVVLRRLVTSFAAELEAVADRVALAAGASVPALARGLAAGAGERPVGALAPAAFAAGRPGALTQRLGLLRRPPRRARVAAQLLALLLLFPWSVPGPAGARVEVRRPEGRANGGLAVALALGPNPIGRALIEPW